MDYRPEDFEAKWQSYWVEKQVYQAKEDSTKPKFYVLDMFPYPSGAGLHVGHPLGYLASDIYSRFKRHKGFNVLHPMGFDSFGLPAEQYAIQTGQHPAITTEQNIKRYRKQLDKMGFCFDWSSEVRTSDPQYYRWTQWIFIQFFHSWYNVDTQKAEDIASLIQHFENQGTANLNAAKSDSMDFTAQEWKNLSEVQKEKILLNYRLAYRSETMVNWCPALGTVLANDEVKDGLSERGGHPVVQKKMMQWSMRISAYANRLLQDLENIDWPEPLKESQRNWIGRSDGALISFSVENQSHSIEIFTTRPDTIFGVSFMVLAPEHELASQITTIAQKAQVEAYIKKSALRSERDRMADTKTVSGVFTGGYALHPFNGKKLPIYLADYVLAGYGTGAIMAVPAHDSRDFAFAKYFGLPIPQVVSAPEDFDFSQNSYDGKTGILLNSDFLNGLEVKEAIKKAIQEIEAKRLGTGKVNFRLRDAIFGRQRYWGEPIPVYYENGIPRTFDLADLPLKLPEVDAYLPTEEGEPPLARAHNWIYKGHPVETTTMPGWAGSSWYYLRYMDSKNSQEAFGKNVVDYWQNVDLYLGGSEHATGHLLYARFWHKFLFDKGLVPTSEPFKKLINQGMIQGVSAFIHRVKGENKFVSQSFVKQYDTQQLHVDVSLTEAGVLNVEEYKKWRPEFAGFEFITEDDQSFRITHEVEKMSKSKFNVVNPDEVIAKYGADTFRMYEMFLGPLEQSKPWNTDGITGVQGFLRKFWRLFFYKESWAVESGNPATEELKVLHKCIKKVNEDMEQFSFNTSVAAFMICVNELTVLKCRKQSILEPLTILLAPFAPHIAEELWHRMGHDESISIQDFPTHNESYLIESSFSYPVSFNGKMRFQIELSKDLGAKEVETAVMNDERSAKYLEGKTPKKVIVVPIRIVNVVV